MSPAPANPITRYPANDLSLVTLPFLLGLLIAALLVYLRRRFTGFEAQRIAD